MTGMYNWATGNVPEEEEEVEKLVDSTYHKEEVEAGSADDKEVSAEKEETSSE